MQNAIYLALILVWPCLMQAQEKQPEKPTRLIDIYNRFIDRFSDGNPAWKTEILLGADVGEPPAPPCKLHYNDSLGYYTYRVKRWEELNDYEKFALQNDPRLPHFVREEASNIRKADPNPSGQMRTARPASSPASAGNAAAPITTPVLVTGQQRGILTRDGTSALAYKFDPDELIGPHPLRLMEVAEQ